MLISSWIIISWFKLFLSVNLSVIVAVCVIESTIKLVYVRVCIFSVYIYTCYVNIYVYICIKTGFKVPGHQIHHICLGPKATDTTTTLCAVIPRDG